MQPVVCNKDMAVVFPLKDGDCEFWLEIVDSVNDITNPSRDHAYVDSKGLFYIYNGKEIQVINDHANLKIKWGNMIGDISNQSDLMEILNQFVKTISVNGTNIAKDNEKNIAIQVPITTIKLDGNTISPVDYIVNLDLASVYAKKTEIPKNVSELQNDAGYIKQIENNVSLNKIGTGQYYVLTESKDKNVKKLDCYFAYDVNYLPAAPYYTDNTFVRDLDLEGYTVKKSFLSNNTCKLKNKSTGELIDYVYLMLDDNVTVTTSKDDPQFVYTEIAVKYLPYFAKLKTGTPVAGHLYVDTCISIILEKTSS